MEKGIYFVIICEKINRNGIAVNPINCHVAELDYMDFKKKIESKDWKIYCRSTLGSPEIETIDNSTQINGCTMDDNCDCAYDTCNPDPDY